MTGPAWTPSGGGGASELPVTSQTTSFTADITDCVILCSGPSPFTVTLPTAAGNAGKFFIIKNVGSQVITVDANGAQTIDGLANYILPIQYDAVQVLSDGANWVVV